MASSGFASEMKEPRPADGYGRPEHRPLSKDNPYIYPMPAITREYVDLDGVRHCRFVTEWVVVDEDSASECYVPYEGE